MNTAAAHDFEAFLETRQLRRMRHEAKMEAIIDQREADAEQMIGELCREGKQILYVWPQGGKYREGTRRELINFLIRNRYA